MVMGIRIAAPSFQRPSPAGSRQPGPIISDEYAFDKGILGIGI
jgi:hypothetical protein